MGQGEGGTNGKSGVGMYTLPCVKQTANGMLHHTGDSARLSAMVRKGGMGGEWEGGPRRRHVCVLMADSHCYMADTNTTL